MIAESYPVEDCLFTSIFQAKLDKLMEANDKRMQDIRQVEAVEIEQLKREKQALVDELDASK